MLTKELLRIKGNALYTVGPDATLADAIASLVENDIGSLVVMERGRLVGMLTFREVLSAVHTGTGTRQVGEVMVRNPPQVGPDVEMDDLRRLMI